MLNAAFFTTVADLAQLPSESVAEVAFAGRSNAGKSSAINAIAQHRRLAFVSKTPGRTQHLNYFQVGPQRFLVDLPGYGYARAPLAQQRTWQALVGGYVRKRGQLRGLMLVMDARHPFTDLDLGLLDWLRATDRPVHVLLSKADKLSRSEGLQVLRRSRGRLTELGVRGDAQLFSSPKRVGLESAEETLRNWLDLPRVAGAATAADTPKKNPAQGDQGRAN